MSASVAERVLNGAIWSEMAVCGTHYKAINGARVRVVHVEEMCDFGGLRAATVRSYRLLGQTGCSSLITVCLEPVQSLS